MTTRRRILIVEDDEPTRERLVRALAAHAEELELAAAVGLYAHTPPSSYTLLRCEGTPCPSPGNLAPGFYQLQGSARGGTFDLEVRLAPAP